MQLHAEEADAELEVAGHHAEEEVEGEDGHGQDPEEREPLVELFCCWGRVSGWGSGSLCTAPCHCPANDKPPKAGTDAKKLKSERQTDLDEVLVEELGLRGEEEHEDHHVQDPERGDAGGDEPHEQEEEGPQRVVVRHVLFWGRAWVLGQSVGRWDVFRWGRSTDDEPDPHPLRYPPKSPIRLTNQQIYPTLAARNLS